MYFLDLRIFLAVNTYSFNGKNPLTPIKIFHTNQICKSMDIFNLKNIFISIGDVLLKHFLFLLKIYFIFKKKYESILSHPNTVGVQIRYYKEELPGDTLYPQYGKEYLKTAMALFPESALFIVSSNNLEFARESIPNWIKNVIFIQNEPNYIDLHILKSCKNNIITNSSFGWWAAWLNENPNKIVVRPNVWIHGLPTQDVCPKEWVTLDTQYN